MAPDLSCPECRAGKHDNCDGTSWDWDADQGVVCPCWADNHSTQWSGFKPEVMS